MAAAAAAVAAGQSRESPPWELPRYTVKLCTFNVNGKPPVRSSDDTDEEAGKRPPPPPPAGLRESCIELAGLTRVAAADTPGSAGSAAAAAVIPDIQVFGFQELDLSPDVLVFERLSPKEIAWTAAIEAHLPPGYEKLTSRILVGMLIIVYVKSDLRPKITNVLTAAVGTGPMGFGNKGAVSIRFELGATSFCFINSHLAAHQENVAKRNEDFHEILEKTQFWKPPAEEPDVQPDRRVPSSSSPPSPEPSQIMQHNRIFWVGDLNYRLNAPMDQIKNYIFHKRLAELFPFDQLKLQQAAKAAFCGFQEGPIVFAPTYKFTVGTKQYSSGAKVRTPAWCDRILFTTPKGVVSGVTLVPGSYRSHPDVLLSDHKPVSATFVVVAADGAVTTEKLEPAVNKATIRGSLGSRLNSFTNQVGSFTNQVGTWFKKEPAT